MNPWTFVVAAYGVAVTFTIVLLLCSFLWMRRAEAGAEALKRK